MTPGSEGAADGGSPQQQHEQQHEQQGSPAAATTPSAATAAADQEAPPPPPAAQPAPPAPPAAAAEPELEPQLKYERLGADVKTILQGGVTASCLALSEKVLALGTSAGTVHVLDYSGNEVKRFPLHPGRPVSHISFDEKAEFFATCCGEPCISITSLYSDETTKFTFKRPITVVALESRYASRKTREFVTGDVRGRLKLSSQGWLGRSDHVLHQGEGVIRSVAWAGSTLVWANEVGIKVYDTNTHQFAGAIKRPRGGPYADCADCQLYLHEADGQQGQQLPSAAAGAAGASSSGGGGASALLPAVAGVQELYVAWADCIKVCDVLSHINPVSGAASKSLHVRASIPTTFFCLGAVPHGPDLAVLVYVTDADPDQGQIGPADPDSSQPQQQLAAAASSGDSQGKQQEQGEHKEEDEGKEEGPNEAVPPAEPDEQQQGQLASAASAAGPINIPQPVRRPQRAANAFVRSPGGPSLLQQAAAAAAAAAGTDAATAPPAAGGAGSGAATVASSPAMDSLASSPSPHKAAPVLAAAAAAAGAASPAHRRTPSGSAAGRPPLPGAAYSRSGSAVCRTSSQDSPALAPYVPPGKPQRPELRILSLTALTSGSGSGHTHAQQQQQLCSGCVEKASDALAVKGYSHYLPLDYSLVPSYGNEFALLSGGAAGRPTTTPSAAATTSSTKRSSSGSGKKRAAAGGGSASQGRQQQRSGGVTTSPTNQQQQPSAPAGSEDDAAAGEAAVERQDTAASPSELQAADSGALLEEGDEEEGQQQEEEEEEELLEDFREFMYFIVSPQDVVIGRHRDMEDRISWALSAGRFEAALSLAEADRSTRAEVWEAVVQAYLDALTRNGQWAAAAGMLPRLLKDSSAAWERWVVTFAQAGQLPLLAPVLPVKQPLLPSQNYDLVLQALLAEPHHHAQLLDLVASWPQAVHHPTQLIDAIAQRMQRPGGESRELWQALALLYKGQGRPDLSLAIYLQLQLPSVFDFIQENSLLLYLDQNAYLLMAIDERRALELLTAHLDTLPPAAVVPGLLDAMAAAEGPQDEAGREVWRHRLFSYLDRVFQADASAASEYAELCVHLYADYCPARLMDFLQGSQTYPLEAALEVAQQRGLIDEQVYVLSRMGNSRAALHLIISKQQDIPRAIEFVRLQQDEELWEELIDWALGSADTTGQLLEHIGGNINPLRVIQKIPEGLEIAHLRDRLRAIITDYRTQTSLREGCNAILRSDCLHLVQRLRREVRKALPSVWVQRQAGHSSRAPAAPDQAAAAAAGGSADGEPAAAAAPDKQQQQVAAASAGNDVGSSSSSGFLPASGNGRQGPQWLQYACASGKPMVAGSSADVPAVAVHALAAAAAAAAAATVPLSAASCAAGAAGARITAEALSPGLLAASAGMGRASWAQPQLQQPAQVWIGRAGRDAPALLDAAAADEAAAGADDAAAASSQQPLSSGGGGGPGPARRSGSTARQQRLQRGGAGGAVSTPPVTLPSLVAA